MKIKSFRNFKIKSKLIALEVVCILGLVIVGGLSIYTAREINQASTDIRQEWLPSVIIAEDLNTDISDYRLKEYAYVITREDKVRAPLEEEMQELRDKVEAGFSAYIPLVTNDTDRDLMERAQKTWSEYLEFSGKLMLMSKNNIYDKALDMMIGESNLLYLETSRLFLDVVNFNKDGAELASIHADILYQKLSRNQLIVVVLIAFMITSLVIYISRAVEKPVEAIVEGTRRVSNGDLDVYLDYRSEDEIGVLTDSVNALIKRLRDIIEDEKHLFYEIGNENFAAKSNCERAYRGDFAPILYSIESLKSRLELIKLHQEGKPVVSKEIILKDLKKGKIERKHECRTLDGTNKKS